MIANYYPGQVVEKINFNQPHKWLPITILVRSFRKRVRKTLDLWLPVTILVGSLRKKQNKLYHRRQTSNQPGINFCSVHCLVLVLSTQRSAAANISFCKLSFLDGFTTRPMLEMLQKQENSWNFNLVQKFCKSKYKQGLILFSDLLERNLWSLL